MLNSMKKILNLKLMIGSKYQNTKICFAKVYTQNWSEEIFIISKIKNAVPWT